MKYTPPNTVTSPRDCVSNIQVIYDGGEESFSVASLYWGDKKRIAMRWNVSEREWSDPAKVSGKKVCIGMPVSRGFPIWFVLPNELLGKNSEVWKLMQKHLSEGHK
jgi:hypothetical protein